MVDTWLPRAPRFHARLDQLSTRVQHTPCRDGCPCQATLSSLKHGSVALRSRRSPGSKPCGFEATLASLACNPKGTPGSIEARVQATPILMTSGSVTSDTTTPRTQVLDD
ncbi:hypothetical protein L6452_32862 [Arctium lappa]|uniref:Uncharacterized protein n=1 Tax=Arctium lappa TaxID=4217 RepID=A0ACB8Z5U3_ARCLA|nr:hypothetical protein L6452_32862 [Arctium lappa]